MRPVRLHQLPYVIRVMLRAQKLMRSGAYMKEHECAAGRAIALPLG